MSRDALPPGPDRVWNVSLSRVGRSRRAPFEVGRMRIKREDFAVNTCQCKADCGSDISGRDFSQACVLNGCENRKALGGV
jgi:hypothetical protein